MRFSIFLCFFLRMRLRRFLISEPMRRETLPPHPAYRQPPNAPGDKTTRESKRGSIVTIDTADGSSPVLDNAVWHSLVGAHAPFAQRTGLALRYEPDVALFSGAPDDSDEAWRDLAALASLSGIVVLFRGAAVTPPAGWEVAFGGAGRQMVCPSFPPSTRRPAPR